MENKFKSVANGLFKVNKIGDVKRKSKSGRYENAPINKTGSRKKYKVTSYTKNGIQKKYYVHHLVAEVFCKKEKRQTQVVFLDGNQDNVHFKNLCWVTPKERYEHARKRGAIKTLDNSGKQCVRCDNPVLHREMCSDCQQHLVSFKVKLLARKKLREETLPYFKELNNYRGIYRDAIRGRYHGKTFAELGKIYNVSGRAVENRMNAVKKQKSRVFRKEVIK